jgi:putative membrane protein
VSWEWQPDAGVLAGAGLALVLFARGFLRLRGRGRRDLASADRALLFGLGVAVATLALVSPLDAVGEDYLLSAHMLQHLLIGDVAPALLVVALRGPLTFFVVPPTVLRALAQERAVRRVLAALLRPRVSFAVWALALGFWHVPAAYDYALAHPLAHELEHVSFMAGGLLVWAQLVDPARRRALAHSGRLLCAACMFVAAQALAGVLLLARSPLFPSYAAEPHRLLGLSALQDQRLAGLVMLAEQTLALGLCAAYLLRPLEPYAVWRRAYGSSPSWARAIAQAWFQRKSGRSTGVSARTIGFSALTRQSNCTSVPPSRGVNVQSPRPRRSPSTSAPTVIGRS